MALFSSPPAIGWLIGGPWYLPRSHSWLLYLKMLRLVSGSRLLHREHPWARWPRPLPLAFLLLSTVTIIILLPSFGLEPPGFGLAVRHQLWLLAQHSPLSWPLQVVLQLQLLSVALPARELAVLSGSTDSTSDLQLSLLSSYLACSFLISQASFGGTLPIRLVGDSFQICTKTSKFQQP